MLRFVRREDRPFTPAARRALHPYDGVLAELLFARGVDTAAQAEAFLHPGMADLYNPMLLSGMGEALALLGQAKAENWPAVVYGDYDTDGVCAAAIATEALRLYGIPAEPHVPLRAEGYGLNLPAVEELAKTYRLLVTVDLGITNAAEVARAKELGMRVIVTDHHQPGLIPCPADAVVNPVLNGYPFPRLCGAGVAYKLAAALLGVETAAQWLELAAIATVADIVPLLSENRAIVALGLPRMGERPGVRALIKAAGCREPLTSEAVAYQLAPRLNAAGRIDDASRSVRLLMTRDPAEAETLAGQLDRANTERKRMEAEATAQAEMQAETHDFVKDRVLFVRGDDWPAGVVGLVAGRLNRRYGVPVCALCGEDGVLHGSLRGVHGINLARCLQTCDDLLLRYGGHEMAAGVTLAEENDEAFRDRLEQAVREAATDELMIPVQEYDAELPFAAADDVLLDALSQLEPFGLGNPAPVFFTGGAQVLRRRACGAQGAHLQLTLRQGDKLLSGVGFGMGAQAATLPDTVDAAYTLARDEYRGSVSVKFQAQAMRPCARALADALAAEGQAAWDNALLAALRAELAAFPTLSAGNSLPDAEVMKATHPAARTGAESARGTAVEPDCAPPKDAATEQAAFGPFVSQAGEPAAMETLLAGRQGTLFVAYARATAAGFLAAYGDRVDWARGVPDDPRCFHTLLTQPEPQITGRWKAVVLLDGPLTLNGAAYWHGLLPGAAVYASAPSQALCRAARALDAGDPAYRGLYRILRRSAFASLAQTAREAALGEAQTLLGLLAFAQLGLIDFSDAPFHYRFREADQCSLSDSPTLGAVRALAAVTRPAL